MRVLWGQQNHLKKYMLVHTSVEFPEEVRILDPNVSKHIWCSYKSRSLASLVKRPFVKPMIFGKGFQRWISDGDGPVALEVNLEEASNNQFYCSYVTFGKWKGGEYPIAVYGDEEECAYWYRVYKTTDPEIFVVLMGENSGGSQDWYDQGIFIISEKKLMNASCDEGLYYKDTLSYCLLEQIF